jgi:hypothetical protein
MSVKRQNRAFRHLVVFALERYFLEQQGNTAGLKGFKAKLWRMAMSLNFDKKLDKKAGASPAYFAGVKAGFARLKAMKKPLVKEGSFFEKDADGAFYFGDKDE